MCDGGQKTFGGKAGASGSGMSGIGPGAGAKSLMTPGGDVYTVEPAKDVMIFAAI